MFDCGSDIVQYHNDHVTLGSDEQKEMRKRRDTNRVRLKNNLAADEKPAPLYFIKQGSYAMWTMVQDDENDYDIDDGCYFSQADLIDDEGRPLTADAMREIVAEALRDARFNRQPQARNSCVRVYYDEGYHVDIPVYRVRSTDKEYELAAGVDWVVSRAADVEEWFRDENDAKSPDETNGRQLRRVVRLLKKFARSRKTWKSKTTSGFAITSLVSERYVADVDREDVSLRSTMHAIRDRLNGSTYIAHPVTPGAPLSKGFPDSELEFFRTCLSEALKTLDVLDDPACDRSVALAAWGKVFNTTFFGQRAASATAAESSFKSAASVALVFPDRPVQPNKSSGYA